MAWDVVNRISRYLSANGRTTTTSGKIYNQSTYGTGTGAGDYDKLTSSATQWTFGSYAELEDSLSAESELCGYGIRFGHASAYVLELATGAEGAEVPFYRFTFNDPNADEYVYVPFGNKTFKFAAGTRIAARISSSQTGTPSTAVIAPCWYQGTEAI